MRTLSFCCPVCKSGLRFSEDRVECGSCRRAYPLDENIPNLFVPWSVPLPGDPHPFPQYLVSAPHIERRIRERNIHLNGSGAVDSNGYFQFPLRRKLLLGRLTIWLGLFLMWWFLPNRMISLVVAMGAFAVDYLILQFLKVKQKNTALQYLYQLSQQNQLHEKDSKKESANLETMQGEAPVVGDRSEDLKEAIQGIDLSGRTVLHVGCGSDGDEDVNDVYIKKGARLIGLDVYLPFLKDFRKRFDSPAVLADALNLPFAENSVDLCNCTDIIEHVHDPFRFLQENLRVLKPGGHILLLTPNRSRARTDFDILNPLVFLQLAIGGTFPFFLKAEDWLAQYKGYVFFHTSFTRHELRMLLEKAGFEVEWAKVIAYRGAFKKLRELLENIPFLSNINDSVVVLAKKPL